LGIPIFAVPVREQLQASLHIILTSRSRIALRCILSRPAQQALRERKGRGGEKKRGEEEGRRGRGGRGREGAGGAGAGMTGRNPKFPVPKVNSPDTTGLLIRLSVFPELAAILEIG
jgi:hypothetical protein